MLTIFRDAAWTEGDGWMDGSPGQLTAEVFV